MGSDTKKKSRRTKDELTSDVMSAVGDLVCEKGYMHITLMDIARAAHADPNVLLRNFGSIQEILDRHAYSIDYWMRTLLDRPELNTKGGREEMTKLLCTLPLFVFENEHFRRLLQWEIADDNVVTRRIAQARELHFKGMIDHYKSLFSGNSNISFDVITSLLIAGTYALIVRRKRSTFFGLDYDKPEVWSQIPEAIKQIIDLVFDRIEEQDRLAEAALRFKQKGVDDQTIAECTGLSLQQVASLTAEKEE